MQTTRRGFFGLVAGAFAWMVAPKVAAPGVQGLKFHPDAFALVMQPPPFARYDVLYGWANLRPGMAARITDDDRLSFAEWAAKHP